MEGLKPAQFNFIVALKPEYSDVCAIYSLDGKQWKKTSLIQVGLRFYGEVTENFNQIQYYIEAKYKGKKTKQFYSKKKPMLGMPFSRMPMMQCHLLEPNPNRNFVQDMDLFAALDMPQKIPTLSPQLFSNLLKKYPDNLLIYHAWIKNRIAHQQMHDAIHIAKMAYKFLNNTDRKNVRAYPFMLKYWISDILWFGGFAAEKIESYETGEQLLQLGSEILPNEGRIWSNYGDMLRHQKKFNECFYAYKQAIRLAPEKLENYRLLMEIYLKNQKIDEAEEILGQLGEILRTVSHPPGDLQRFNVETHIYAGKIAKSRQNFNQARTSFMKGQQVDPRNPFNNFEMAKLEFELGNKKEAKNWGILASKFHPYPKEIRQFLNSMD